MINVAAEADSLSNGDLLTLLLSVEGFMFAAITLAVTLNAPDPKRQRKYPKLKVEALLLGAVGTLSFVGVGALSAWSLIFTGGAYRGHAEAVGALALLLGVVAQPVIALLLALAARRA